MGGFTMYDDVTGNPLDVPMYYNKECRNNDNDEDDWNRCYDWHEKVRIVFKDSKVSNIGQYIDGKIKIKEEIFEKKRADDFYLILDQTYKYLKLEKKFKVNKNKLYEIIKAHKSFPIRREYLIYPCNKYEGGEYLFINEFPRSMENFDENSPTNGIDSWAYVNPDIKQKTKVSKRHKKESERNMFRMRKLTTALMEVIPGELV